MKFSIFILSLMLAFSAFAGNMTITTTDAQDARLVVAFGTYLELTDGGGAPRDATGAEIKQAVIDFIKKTVKDEEITAAEGVAASAVTEIEPT